MFKIKQTGNKARNRKAAPVIKRKYPMKLSKMGLEHERCLICKEDAKCRKIYIYNIGLELSDNQLFKEIIDFF